MDQIIKDVAILLGGWTVIVTGIFKFHILSYNSKNNKFLGL